MSVSGCMIATVRSPSAVAPATDSTSQRCQPPDLLFVNAANAVNVHPCPVLLVRGLVPCRWVRAWVILMSAGRVADVLRLRSMLGSVAT